MKKKKTPKRRPRKHFGFTQIYDHLNLEWIPVWTLSKEASPTPEGMPESVSILGQKYRVRYRKQIYSAPKKSAALDGIVIFSDRLIILDPDHSIHEMRQTLYHEMCHVYLCECFKKDLRLYKMRDKMIEGVCDMFGEAVYDLVLNNPLPK